MTNWTSYAAANIFIKTVMCTLVNEALTSLT